MMIIKQRRSYVVAPQNVLEETLCEKLFEHRGSGTLTEYPNMESLAQQLATWGESFLSNPQTQSQSRKEIIMYYVVRNKDKSIERLVNSAPSKEQELLWTGSNENESKEQFAKHANDAAAHATKTPSSSDDGTQTQS